MSRYGEKSVWLLLLILYFKLQVIYKSYRQVLTPVNTSQLLLKLESLDKLKLVIPQKNQHKETCIVVTVSYQFKKVLGETRVLMTLTHRASVKMLITLGMHFLSAQLKL
jgi:hypothetical protein